MGRQVATACVLAVLTVVFYSLNLQQTPLAPAEAVVVQQAAARPAALFVHVADEKWMQPAAVYATALVQAFGGGEYAGRMASIAVGALNVALLYVAATLMAGEWAAVAAAVILMATPAHAWMARTGIDAIYPVPFVLVWLIAMLRFVQFDSPRALMLAALALGAGSYTHQTAPLTMAWLWGVSIVGLIAWRRAALRNVVSLAAGFAIGLLPAVLWFARHPETYPDTFGRWAVFAAHIRFPLDGLRAQVNWNTLGTRASIFWGLLDPSFLFFAPDGQATAPLLLCMAVLGALGLERVLTKGPAPQRLLMLAALGIPLIIASTFSQPHELNMAGAMLVIVAAACGVGLASLRDRRGYWKAIVLTASAVSAYQLLALYNP